MHKRALLFGLLSACLASSGERVAAPAKPATDLSGLLEEAARDARACELERARSKYESARQVCGACEPAMQVELELLRVELALLEGQPLDVTLASSLQLGNALEAAHPIDAAHLFAELGRWQSPQLFERAAQALERTPVSPRRSAHEVLWIVASDPDFVQHSEIGRSWAARYELGSYHWQAPGSSAAPDDRYVPGACRSGSPRIASIADADQQFSSKRIVFGKCFGDATFNALPSQRELSTVLVRVVVDQSGAVTRFDAHGAFTPPTLLQCLGDSLRNAHWDPEPQGAIGEAYINYL